MERNVINRKIKLILKNRGMSLEEAGKKLGVTKQRVSYVLLNRKDSEWGEKEKMWWSEKLRIGIENFEGGGR